MKKLFAKLLPRKLSIESNSTVLTLQESIPSYSNYKDFEFEILNLTKKFDEEINWDFLNFGLFWCNNLNYFDYLSNLSKEDGLELIYNYIDNSKNLKIGFKENPISIRGINWIKFITKHSITDKKIDNFLFANYKILTKEINYKADGDKILDTGFSLLFASYYFEDEKFYNLAKKILKKELKKQILDDGAHFELSLMYHQLILFRILDSINLVKYNKFKNFEMLSILFQKANLMLNWINTLTFKNGNIPLLNRSTNNFAPTTAQLIEYSERIGINFEDKRYTLLDSGYKKRETKFYEIVMNFANRDRNSLNFHNDTFNFVLNIDKNEFIVDSAISTYEDNLQKEIEKNQISHNLVSVKNQKITSNFKILNLRDEENLISASHKAYKKSKIEVFRQFSFLENQIDIIDEVISKKEQNAIAYFHFDYKIEPIFDRDRIVVGDKAIEFQNFSKIKLENYKQALSFNRLVNAKVAKVYFKSKLISKVIINNFEF